MIGWNENSPEQSMQYFMLNRITRSFIKNLLKMVKFGAFKVKEAAVSLISRFLVNVPSSAKKQQIMMSLRDDLHFENTRSSTKQIMYLKILNQILPNSSVKHYK